MFFSRFKNKSLLYTHLKVHTIPSKERELRIWGPVKSYLGINTLLSLSYILGYKKLRIRRAKKRQQSNRTEYKCMECDETFSNRLELRQHNRMHDAECSFKCNECGRYFRSKASRRQHRSMHTGERPYECPLCDKT